MQRGRTRQTQFERRDEAERRIVEATIRLVSQRGFANLTLSEIGEEAGYSRGLPAHYFGRKENLVLAVVDHILREFRRYAFHRTSRQTNPSIAESLRSYVKAVRRNRDITRATVMIYAEALINPIIAERIQTIIMQRVDAFVVEIEEEIAAQRMAPIADIRSEAARTFAFLRGELMLHAIDPAYPLEEAFAAFTAGRYKT